VKPEIEFFRIISIFGITWFHSGVTAGKDIAYGGLIFFTIVSVYFSATSKRDHRVFERIERLIIPCVIWSIFYGLFSLILKDHIFPENYNTISKILATPAIHLWFLPFIFIVTITIDRFRFLLLAEWFQIIIGASAVISIISAPIWREVNYIAPFGQYAHALPAVLIGLFLSTYSQMRVKLRLFITLGLISSILLMLYKQESGIGVPYIIGLAPCIFLFRQNILIKHNELLLWVASSTFGVYLLHIFTLSIMKHVGVSGIALPIFAFIIALCTILLFKKYVPKKLSKYIA